MTDADLISEAAQGSAHAFEMLYRRHSRALYGYAWLLTKSVPQAEDLTQECFLALIRRPEAFDASRSALRTWLFAVLRRQYKTLSRKYFREDSLTGEENELPARMAGLEQELITAERAEAVRRAMAALPLLQREALFLFEFEGLSLADTAQILGIEVNALKGRIHRGRQGLKQLLGIFRPVIKE